MLLHNICGHSQPKTSAAVLRSEKRIEDTILESQWNA
jgi:hypothetical protein